MISIEPLYRRVFGQDIPGPVLAHFQRACALELLHLNTRDWLILRAIQQHQLDPIAVELALRRTDAGNGLTRMMRLLAYLTEALGYCQPLYLSRSRSPLVVVMVALFELIRSAWLLCKGSVQLRALNHA